MAETKISVIIPVYNTGKYLEETLMSIVNQTILEDIEVIMIDDGSLDSSKYIIDIYSNKYDNFHAYHKENEGLAKTRNFGMELAKGEYIHFIDSDDLITPNSYEKLYNVSSENDYDIICGNALRFNNYNIWKDQLFVHAYKDLKEDKSITNLSEMPTCLWDTISCNKLFKKEFLEKYNIRFPNKKILYEDIIFTLKAYYYASSIYFSKDIFYLWRQRKATQSITQKINNIQNSKDRLEILNYCLDFINNHDFDDTSKEIVFSKWLKHDLRMFAVEINEYHEEYHEEFLENIKNILNEIPDDVKNNSTSFCRIMYNLIENNNFNELYNFVKLEDDFRNANIPIDKKEKYSELIDLNNDSMDEDLIIRKSCIEQDAKNIYINFNTKIRYIADDYPHKTTAKLINSNNEEFDLESTNNQITIPIDLIREIHQAKIKITYQSDTIKKENYLENISREILNFDDFDLEIGIGINRLFILNSRQKNDNKIEINKITFDDYHFCFEGKSKSNLDNIQIENVVSFDKFNYPIECSGNDDSFDINFKISLSDILYPPIKKWEIKSSNLFNSISLHENFEFYFNNNKVLFTNRRNKVLIENDIYNKIDKLYELNEQIKKLNKDKVKLRNKINTLKNKNKKLSKDKKVLKSEISILKEENEKYQDRKVVKFVDKMKN